MRRTRLTQYAEHRCGYDSDYVPFTRVPRLNGQPGDGKIHSTRPGPVNHNGYATWYEGASDVASHSQEVAITEMSVCAA
ncbi:hypothetical protein PEP31012_01664 [Pandoraea eparura]|jgi:hypothetical protein|uniref:Uncharacterized protein n=1 Tax=Pandoraea eparura TaxID=2508291 RepID=A0A5E4TXP6_9BURK|nr:hypothetical protein PEP31012_01664 [Pandoraea eparura]